MQAGATAVAVVDAAPGQLRGGNSSLTKSMRFSWRDSAQLARLLRTSDARLVEELAAGRSEYANEQYLDDWLRVSGGEVDTALIASIIGRSAGAITWMYESGQRWEPRRNPLPGDVPVVLEGGGQGLQDRNFGQFEQLGGKVFHDSAVTDIEVTVDGLYRVKGSGPAFPATCAALVLASGGFQGNERMRERHLGEPWRNVKLRGVPFNKGVPLMAAIAIGADQAGNWAKCHATPQGILLPDHMLPGQMRESHALARYAYPRGIVVNRKGHRFFDEAADHGNLTYVTLGQKILEQPEKVAFQIFDKAVLDARLLPESYLEDPASVVAASIEDGARRLFIDVGNLVETVRAHPGVGTPPYLFVPVVCGLTFTYGGLSGSPNAEVLGGGRPMNGLYATGEIVGGLYDQGYPAGTGLLLTTPEMP
ncbi:tricarballylate dehydrogenase [Kibdelosporangium phytohabitans]|uniref:Tricarballylate dehydrogenase n=1 Tax=Kibdelosporangium phytohabitans TaxID=860235 RepID=A0A0N9I823_9PSEU|nr:FAD-binding protein [Kibdelosporangium phytohabitans]ALG12334.1 tricarballylate dehydrogenase [Kibdelosporangium phytohabitans]MBE1463895.1 tricarballylate dehydrogenase [Kibdelosporangium phytohabitans]